MPPAPPVLAIEPPPAPPSPPVPVAVCVLVEPPSSPPQARKLDASIDHAIAPNRVLFIESSLKRGPPRGSIATDRERCA
jgi:hypothetical protein